MSRVFLGNVSQKSYQFGDFSKCIAQSEQRLSCFPRRVRRIFSGSFISGILQKVSENVFFNRTLDICFWKIIHNYGRVNAAKRDFFSQLRHFSLN